MLSGNSSCFCLLFYNISEIINLYYLVLLYDSSFYLFFQKENIFRWQPIDELTVEKLNELSFKDSLEIRLGQNFFFCSSDLNLLAVHIQFNCYQCSR